MPTPARLKVQRNARSLDDHPRSLQFPHFAFVCPLTGQLDQGSITVNYTPNRLSLTAKSFELYLSDFRHTEVRREQVVNQILDDLIKMVHPRDAVVQGQFRSRDGFRVRIEACYPSHRGGVAPTFGELCA
jgi:7-cyano-7-deazaguanine reductase